MEAYTGNCLCGGVAFRVTGALAPIQICHCCQCRHAQGTPFVTNIPVHADSLSFERGRELIREFESSSGKFRAFCSHCGSPVYSRLQARPGVFRIRAGLLNEPLETRPESHAYVDSRANWWPLEDALPKYPEARE